MDELTLDVGRWFLNNGPFAVFCIILLYSSWLDRKEKRAMWNELLQVAKDASGGYKELSALIREMKR